MIGGPTGCPGPHYIAEICVLLRCIIICQLYKLILLHKAQVTLQLTVSLSDLVQRYLAGPSSLGKPKFIYFLFPPPGPERALGDRVCTPSSQQVIEGLVREELVALP
jgi:hypothetical protein